MAWWAKAGDVMRGKGYDGVLVLAGPGVVPPRMVLPDSVELVRGSEPGRSGGDMELSSWMGEMRVETGPGSGGSRTEGDSLISIWRARFSRYWLSWRWASPELISAALSVLPWSAEPGTAMWECGSRGEIRGCETALPPALCRKH